MAHFHKIDIERGRKRIVIYRCQQGWRMSGGKLLTTDGCSRNQRDAR